MTQTIHCEPVSWPADLNDTVARPIRVGILDEPLIVAGLGALLKPYGERVEVCAPAEDPLSAVATWSAAHQQGRAVPASPCREPLDVLLVDLARTRSTVRAPLNAAAAQGTRIVDFGWDLAAQRTVSTSVDGRLGAVLQVDAYIGKGEPSAEMVRIIEKVCARREAGLARATGPNVTRRGDLGHAACLSRRECDVLALITEGYTNLEIAAELYLSVNSVKSYIRTSYRKVGVTRRSEAVRWVLTQSQI